MIQIKMCHGQDGKIFADAKAIREEVFIEEQGVDPAIEYDEFDKEAYHFVAYQESQAIGTGRIRPLNKQDIKVQRLAVLQDVRHLKVGSQLLKAIEDWAQAHGYHRLTLGAQVHAKDFYLKNAYELASEESFLDAGIPHVEMVKNLKKSS